MAHERLAGVRYAFELCVPTEAEGFSAVPKF